MLLPLHLVAYMYLATLELFAARVRNLLRRAWSTRSVSLNIDTRDLLYIFLFLLKYSTPLSCLCPCKQRTTRIHTIPRVQIAWVIQPRVDNYIGVRLGPPNKVLAHASWVLTAVEYYEFPNGPRRVSGSLFIRSSNITMRNRTACTEQTDDNRMTRLLLTYYY